MNRNGKFECLMFISQIHRSQFDERRRYEFKILFTSLSFYVFSVAAIYGGKITLPIDLRLKLMVWIMFIAIAGVTSIFLANVHMANHKNKRFAEKAENAIAELSEVKEFTSLFSASNNYWVSWGSLFKRGIRGRWAWFWEVVTLFSFSIASAMLVTLK